MLIVKAHARRIAKSLGSQASSLRESGKKSSALAQVECLRTQFPASALLALKVGMFNCPVRHGPVVHELFEEFRHFKGNPITNDVRQENNVDTSVESLLDSVWKAYEPYTDVQLSKITHSHPPWIDAYRSDEWFAIMSPESIRDHFKQLLESNVNP